MKLLNLKPGSIVRHQCKCCNTVHVEIPADAKPWNDDEGNVIAWDFQCDCKSNMFIKNVEDTKGVAL